MRKKLLILVPIALLVAFAAWAAYHVSRPEPEWTASSPAALAALQRGIEAERKYYRLEAYGHFTEAVRLDPRCAGCRLGVLRNARIEPDAAKEMVAELRRLDRDRLNERERFLVDYTVARFDDDYARATALASEYAARHPDDPYALEAQAEELWRERRFDEVEKVYERMLEIDPNYVTAQNRLGYLAMREGDLASAEDRFRTYRYVAPDQANPHDSLGELFVLTGRWDEARAELEEALRIRPDFCASYGNLIDIAILTGRPEEGLPVLERASQPGRCEDYELDRYRCRVELWGKLIDGRYEELSEGFEDSCAAELRVSPWIPQIAALLHGDLETARDIESWRLAEQRKRELASEDDPVAPHLAGLRLVAEGEPAEAARRFAAADGPLGYWSGDGLFKLFNRLQWVNALERAGDREGAAKLLSEVAAVNPALAEGYHRGLPPRPEPLAGGPARRRGATHEMR
jgi:hypothetical protein